MQPCLNRKYFYTYVSVTRPEPMKATLIPRQTSSDTKLLLPRQMSADQLMFLNQSADHGITSHKQTADHAMMASHIQTADYALTSQAPKLLPRKMSTEQTLLPVMTNNQLGGYASFYKRFLTGRDGTLDCLLHLSLKKF